TNIDERPMDRAELEQQLQALHADSFTWALACCDRDRADAEDVLQTVYVKIFDGKARYEARASLKTWLFAVIRKTAASHRRTRWFARFRSSRATATTRPSRRSSAPSARPLWFVRSRNWRDDSAKS